MTQEIVQKEERKDFPDFIVSRVFMKQDGICANKNCGNPLSHGFHRHHKDGNPGNNSEENCELFCMECHYAKKDKEGQDSDNPWKKHKKVEEKVLEQVTTMVEQLLGKEKLSGASAERVMDGLTLMMKTSREINGIDRATEYPPASIKVIASTQRQEELLQARLDAKLEGIKEGFSLALSQGIKSYEYSIKKKK